MNPRRQSVRPKSGAVTIREPGSPNVTAVAPPQASRLAEARLESDQLKIRLATVGRSVVAIRKVLERDAEKMPPETLEAITAACNAALVDGLGLDGIEVAYDAQPNAEADPAAADPAAASEAQTETPTPAASP